MKLRYTLEDVDMGDEIISVPVGESAGKVHGILKMNAASQEILNLLRHDITEDEIVTVLAEKYENDRNQLAIYVKRVLSELREAGLLEE